MKDRDCFSYRSWSLGLTAAWVVLALLLASPSARAAEIVLWVNNAPGEGFNNTEPVEPVGGNTGTTLGEQRRIAFLHAAEIWARQLVSEVPIVVEANFKAAFCSGSSALLGWAGADGIKRDFPGAIHGRTYYHAALADSLAKKDLDPGKPDIFASFNSALDRSDCLAERGWYYGLDGKNGEDVDIVQVIIHEMGHGLGFSNFVEEGNGSMLGSKHGGDIFTRFTYDVTQEKYWSDMTDAERAKSATNTHRVVWSGEQTRAAVHRCLEPGSPSLWVDGTRYQLTAAKFGPALSADDIEGELTFVSNKSGGGEDGCEPLHPLDGKIALVQRTASCAPEVQAHHAADAGALGVLIVADSSESPVKKMPDSRGDDPSIPALQISQADGQAVAAFVGEEVVMVADEEVFEGADAEGRVMLYAPNPVKTGSSISHWVPRASPGLLMEPFSVPGLPQTLDLSLYALADMGWEIAPTGDPCSGESAAAVPMSQGSGTTVVDVVNARFPGREQAGCSAAHSGARNSGYGAGLLGLIALGAAGLARRVRRTPRSF